jgi:hypothetical protein
MERPIQLRLARPGWTLAEVRDEATATEYSFPAAVTSGRPIRLDIRMSSFLEYYVQRTCLAWTRLGRRARTPKPSRPERDLDASDLPRELFDTVTFGAAWLGLGAFVSHRLHASEAMSGSRDYYPHLLAETWYLGPIKDLSKPCWNAASWLEDPPRPFCRDPQGV